MIKKDFWDSVKQYIDLKMSLAGTDIKNVLDQYDWEALKNLALPDVSAVIHELHNGQIIQDIKDVISEPMRGQLLDLPNVLTKFSFKISDFGDRYFGPLGFDPVQTSQGLPLGEGSLYWNTNTGGFRVFTQGVWLQLVFPTPGQAPMSDDQIKAAYENNANTNEYDDTEQNKLAGIEYSATSDMTASEMEAEIAGLIGVNFMTDAEKAKLATTPSVLFKGVFQDLAALQAAHPSATEGAHAFTDDGSLYRWDTTVAGHWEITAGGSVLSAVMLKSMYESNADTNAFTDNMKNKLALILANTTVNLDTLANQSHTHTNSNVLLQTEAAFTNALKNKIDNIPALPLANKVGFLKSDGAGNFTVANVRFEPLRLIGELI